MSEYADIFAEPKGLPAHRNLDHKIVLKPGTAPINGRPYRYPTLQKDVIENAVREMLQLSLIHI